MKSVIAELSKYIIVLLAGIYTYLSFAVFRKYNVKMKNKLYGLQGFMTLLLHLTGYLLIFLQTENPVVIYLYLFQLLFFVISKLVYQKLYKEMSMTLFNHMQFFLMTGFIMLARLSLDRGIKQTAVAAAAVFLCLLVPKIIEKWRFLQELGWLYAAGGLILLLLVLLMGSEVYGARNWLRIFGFGFQPSEFVKLLFVFAVAALLAKRRDFKQVVLVTAMAGFHVIILVLEKDLGGALLFFITYIILLFVVTRNYWYLLAGAVSGAIAAVAAYHLFSHIQVRVSAWLDPWSLIDKEGFQVAQSLFGIGTGGWFGMGLGKGLPSSIPVVNSDFIFSALSEEMGGLFVICLLLVYVSCFLMFIHISLKIKQDFHRYIAIGLSVMFLFQVFLSVGGAVKFIPSTGVTLPLISYGGSSLLSVILMFSVVQGLYLVNAKKAGERQKGIKTASEIRGVMYVFVGVFVAMTLYLSYFIGIDSKGVVNNVYNHRQDLFAKEVLRGQIKTEDGKILAYTKEDDEGADIRIYPYKNLFSHAVGRTEKGKTGVEQTMNFELLTSNDNPFKKLAEKMSGEKNLGDTVITTLDYDLQKIASDALGSNRGAVVAMDPATGKVLVMVSKPDFDPNTVGRDWEELNAADDTSSVLLNRASNGLYPPGSTFKVLTVLEYIRETPDYKKFTFDCKGSLTYKNSKINCAHNTVHGKLDLAGAFAKSCNSAFASMGLGLDLAGYHSLCDEFLFNKQLPTSYTYQNSSFTMKEGAAVEEIMQTSIGQGKTLITPLHNAMIAAAVANGGILMKPYVVDRVETYDGSSVKKYWPSAYGSLMTAEESEILDSLMKNVVKNGFASSLQSKLYQAAGKTGTAEYIERDGSMNAHAWFIGYAEKDGRMLAVSVIVEGAGSGGTNAVPVAKKVLDAYYQRK